MTEPTFYDRVGGHAPFTVTPTQATRWVAHMSDAVDTLGLAPEDDQELRAYLVRAAQFMINAPEDSHG